MPRFFLSADHICGDTVTITGEDALHISRSLRMRSGEKITVCDMQKNEYECELVFFTADTVSARILEARKNETEPVYRAILYQALPKGDKMEYIVQKAVELGVSEIIPFSCERCISRLDDKSAKRKTERWQKIADGAAKQCGRGALVPVREPMTFSEAMKQASGADIPLFCYEGDGTTPLSAFLSDKDRLAGASISIVIGPEGGFSVSEVERVASLGCPPVGLGKRILRCETASGFVLSCICFAAEL